METVGFALGLVVPPLIFLLVCGVVGVACARSPLDRRGYWLRINIQVALLIAIAVGVPALFAELPASMLSVAHIFAIRAVVGAAYVALFAYGFHLEGRRCLDAGASRWWALLGAVPLAFVVFGLLPSHAQGAEDVAKTFE